MIPALVLFAAAVVYRLILGYFGGSDSWLPNFAPVAAIALCGPCVFPRRVAIVLPLAILFASDVLLNLHYGASLISGEMLVRFLALAAITCLGFFLGSHKRMGTFLLASLGASVFFYLATNTASWLTAPEYAKSFAGWWQALTVGIPGYPPTWTFFRNSVVSDLLFTALFVGCLVLQPRLSFSRPVPQH